MVNFPTWIPDCDSHRPALLDLCLLTLVFVFQLLFLHWEILIMLFQFLLTFHQIHSGLPRFIALFSAACAVAIVDRNHFFCLYQKDKSSDSKVKFRQASNFCKRVLEAANFAYANKTKESITFQKLGSRDLANC